MSGSIAGRGKTFFSSPQRPDSCTDHPISYSMGTGSYFKGEGGKAAWADHSPSSGVEVKNGGAISPVPRTSS
jgi:hypothetical protein